MKATVHVKGIVQGVGFRPFIYNLAMENDLTGYVVNMGDAGVEIVAEGSQKNIICFLKKIRENKPALALIEKMDVQWVSKKPVHKSFVIKKSITEKTGEKSIIPPDVSICDKCIQELEDKSNRRHNYFFTTCTNCGPRYTIITNLPYDRPTTTMKPFPPCRECEHEYTNPKDRRYHAQTIACHKCGPQVYFTDGQRTYKSLQAITTARKLLSQGHILAIKGNGGFHLACSIRDASAIQEIRKYLGRKQKPFAVMVQDIPTAEQLVHINKHEKKILTSPVRPIVVLEKKTTDYNTSLIAPDLHTMGIMLPYTGLHYLLFHQTDEKAYVMTSANFPGGPIICTNEKIKEFSEYALYYNREIFQRCDDSLIRFVDDHPVLLRRSRGYVPLPVFMPFHAKNIVALGPELDGVTCILTGDKAFLSQYIGNTTEMETLQFLEEATRHLLHLTNTTPEAVACDLHPRFNTTRLAKDWSENLNIPLVQVQHHHAHVASVMVENNLGMYDKIMGIDADGAGYGDDGTIWGGEILSCTLGGYSRVGHLEEQLLVGGDLATRYPLRIVASILFDSMERGKLARWLYGHAQDFPHGRKEIDLILSQREKGYGNKTSSCGRILDAVAALLNICTQRTYEGEPAMKLEAVALGGKDTLDLEPRMIHDSIVDTTYLLEEIWNSMTDDRENLAFSAQSYLARSLASIAIKNAKKRDIEIIGFSGGCAYNDHLSRVIRKEITDAGFRFIRNRQVPPGDGGVALGQAAVTYAQMI